MKKIIHNRYIALLINILIVYLMYAACRLVFYWLNASMYADMTAAHLLYLMGCALVFDSPAIIYTNIVVMLMLMVPVHGRIVRPYYATARWIYVVSNGLCLIANLMDAVYFPFTGKRTTCAVFREFGNEGAGAMAKILWEQVLANWYLVPVAALFIYILWRAFVVPAADPMRPKRALKIALNVVLFVAMGYLCWGLTRGGFTGATRPITMSNATQYAAKPPEAGLILNTPFSLIRTINKRPMSTPQYMDIEDAYAISAPRHSRVAADSIHGRARGMNVVVMILESFGKQNIGYYNIDRDENGPQGLKASYTPFLDSLLRTDALTYRYSYANSRKSIEAMPAVLSSLPNFIEPFILTIAAINDISGIAGMLADDYGYDTSFYHGALNGSMGFEAFANSTGFQHYYGRTEYNQDPRYNGDADFDGTWAIWDEEFLQFFADKLAETPQPFMSAVFTASSHTPFAVPERYEGKLPEGTNPLQRCIAYSDNALRMFFQKAKDMPWFDHTVFILTADHTSQPVDDYYQSTLGKYAVPIIIYAPGIEQLRGYDSSVVAEHIDILPTLMALMGYEGEYVAFGKDLFSNETSRNHALHWLPEIEGYEYVGDGIVGIFSGDRLVEAYALDSDILQQRNIIGELPRERVDSIERKIKAEIQAYVHALNNNELR